MTEMTARDVRLDAYESIACDPRYAHFINIPQRIIRCLDHFAIEFNCNEVRRRLLAYYLFIGVVDDAIDSGKVEVGREILERFYDRLPGFPDRTSRVDLAIEVLKDNICEEIYPAMLSGLDELYQAVVNERNAESIAAFIEQRKNRRPLDRRTVLFVSPSVRGKRAKGVLSLRGRGRRSRLSG